MRTKKFLIVGIAASVMSLCGAMKAVAQENIEKVLKELENKGVEVNSLIKRNSKKQIYFSSRSLSFISKEGNYARQLENAFEKDGENASSVSKSKAKSNATVTLIFRGEKSKAIYCLVVSGKKEEPNVTVSVSYRDRSVEADKGEWNIEIFDTNGASLNERLEEVRTYDWKGMVDDWKDAVKVKKQAYLLRTKRI